MKNRYIIGGIIIVLGIAAGIFIGKKAAVAPAQDGSGMSTTTSTTVLAKPVTRNTAAKTPAMTKSGAYLVTYLNSGFSPATLTIKRGKAVHFLNSSSKAMSIIAADQYSQFSRELNQEQSVGRGGYYDFSFVTPGTWVYTNRNNKTDRGTIIVE